jgi:hypothetical protein
MSELAALLFARPSFLEGVGRVIDFGGTLTEFNGSVTGAVADAVALASDWQAIGEDLEIAMDTAHEQEKAK